MAQRKAQQRTRAPDRTREARSASRASGSRETSAEALRQERDALRKELAAARAEIERLREVQAQVLNRIDWVVDSLNTLSDEEP